MFKLLIKDLSEAVVIGNKQFATERGYHLTMFKLCFALIGFLATAYLSYLFALVPLEVQINTDYTIALAEASYNVNSTQANSEMNSVLANAKLDAAEQNKKLISAVLDLLSVVGVSVVILISFIFMSGFFHWWKYALNRHRSSMTRQD
ncbi:hypothetical protein [Vibrio vulnificus]|uniref:hypothetical protein n=1 Tax=Vibrio vulnificus TaxID=672 RepID=UPI003ED9D254